ncbi:hypothetical protein [Rhizobium azibense]|uniref:Uncharacterized protein n=1 Tax=Rhizobium azibense TaxID=1136135 RepID=A0A4R3RH99_9HYPH|nr:hypothetical protein [Rhizobium azibense]TCU32862.1 hypothetical protein EV129_11884 [Rhizobium azibense]
MAWTVNLQDREITITTAAIDVLKARFVRDEELLSRMSESWWRDIFVHMVAFGIDPTEIIQAVHNVEAGKPNSDVTVTKFRDESLKALLLHGTLSPCQYLPSAWKERPQYHCR